MKILNNKKSPFLVIEEFVSPLLCETIVDNCDFFVPDTDKDGHNVYSTKTNEQSENIIYERIRSIIPIIQDHYNLTYKGTEIIQFEWFPVESKKGPKSENSEYLRNGWVRVKSFDLSAILFLSDYQSQPPFDSDFEVYGGKLEFAQHGFGFTPTRGTLIIFPSGPNFINNTAEILYGNLFQARFHIAAQSTWKYEPSNFSGNYTTWFDKN